MTEDCFTCALADRCIYTWICYDNPDGFICKYGYKPKEKKNE